MAMIECAQSIPNHLSSLETAKIGGMPYAGISIALPVCRVKCLFPQELGISFIPPFSSSHART